MSSWLRARENEIKRPAPIITCSIVMLSLVSVKIDTSCAPVRGVRSLPPLLSTCNILRTGRLSARVCEGPSKALHPFLPSTRITRHLQHLNSLDPEHPQQMYMSPSSLDLYITLASPTSGLSLPHERQMPHDLVRLQNQCFALFLQLSSAKG